MSLTLLLDLDDTLLVNPMDRFLPSYLDRLSNHLSTYSEPARIISNLLAATRTMSANTLPNRTLKAVFNQSFYPAMGWEEEAIRPAIKQFYQQEFPKLGRITHPNPGTENLITTARQRGYRVAITTNPLFPRTAINQRLGWAGLAEHVYPFDLVTSFETFHFAKPNPAFYAECLARLGWPEGPVMMVGDDPINDIQAAGRAGIATYFVNQGSETFPPGEVQPTGNGPLTDFIDWLDAQPSKTLEPNYNSPDALLACLRSTPAALDSLCVQVAPENWNQRPEPHEWCQTEILCHLRDVELEVNLFRVEKVLAERNPFLSGQDTDPWSEKRVYICQDGPQALQSYIEARQQLIALLEHLTPADWQRTARHAIFGPTTLREIVSIICAHDRLHIRQIKSVIQAFEQK